MPEELRHNTDNMLLQKMQLLALIRHTDTRENIKEHYLWCLKMIIRKQHAPYKMKLLKIIH